MNAPIHTQDEIDETGHDSEQGESEQGESHLVFANGVEEKRDELPPHSQDKAGDKLRKGRRQGFNNTVSCKPASFSPTKSTDTKGKMFLKTIFLKVNKTLPQSKTSLRDTMRKFFSVGPQTVGRRFLC
jgi:hypothetical protein